MSEIIRCPWCDAADELMREYHDTQWGKPCRDERTLFEMLILEGAQAGLSWSCVLHKRENYRIAFDNWDIAKIAAYDERKVAELLQNSGIVRNKLKINATIGNAKVVLKLGSLSNFIWGYVDGKPIVNHWRAQSEIPTTTPLSDKISKDMKKLGFKFAGSTTIYSYLQAIGAVNDHIESCSFRVRAFIKRIFLVDFENVHTSGLKGAKLLSDDDEIIIFYSTSNEKSVSFIRELRSDIQYAKIAKSGQNALDFQLSSYLGFIIKEAAYAETLVGTQFIIVSKDKGFKSVEAFWTSTVFAQHLKISPQIIRTDSIYSALFPTPPKRTVEALMQITNTLDEFHTVLVKEYGMTDGSELYVANKLKFKELKKHDTARTN